MGLFRKGFNGGFKGKVGKVVGSNWRDLEVIRSVPRPSNKPATEKQLMQQAKFAVVIKFLQSFKEILDIGFMNERSGKATGYNMAVKEALYGAVTNTYPNYQLDYSSVVISKGGVGKALDAVLDEPVPQTLRISWMQWIDGMGARTDDKAIIVFFNETKEAYLASRGDALRADAEYQVPVPAAFSGDTFHAWIFFVNTEGTRPSNSVYAGMITLS